MFACKIFVRRFCRSTRVYESVQVLPWNRESIGDEHPHEVMIDGRVLRTPARQSMALPNRALAMAVAAEWEWQTGRKVLPFTMPLTTIATTAVDQMPLIRERTVREMLDHFTTDTACCRHGGDRKLQMKQAELLDPIIKIIEDHIQKPIKISHDLMDHGQDASTMDAVRKMLQNLSNWELAALDMLTHATKSLVIALAVHLGKVSPSQALRASRVEEDFQMEDWGLVEGGHDIDISDLKVRIAAPSIFLRLLDYH